MARDWKDIKGDSKEKYQLYLCSREWAERRRAVHKRAGGLCERCRVNRIDAVHHLTYENIYREPLEDLLATCNGCHEFTHAKSDIDPRSDRYRKLVNRVLDFCGEQEKLAHEDVAGIWYQIQYDIEWLLIAKPQLELEKYETATDGQNEIPEA